MTSVTRILRANVHDDDTPASTSSRNTASVIDATSVRIHTRDASQACYTQSVVKSDEIWQLPKEHCTKAAAKDGCIGQILRGTGQETTAKTRSHWNRKERENAISCAKFCTVKPTHKRATCLPSLEIIRKLCRSRDASW